MSKESLTPDSKFSLTIKELIAAAVGFSSLIAMYFTLQADIAKAMELPEPEISKVEYELKDELVRQTIMDTQEDVEMLLEKFEKMEERIYELTKDR